MRLGKRAVVCLLLVLGCANLLIRLPSTTHEMGVDSFVWHGMATSVQQEGSALWILSPLSYLGLYPLSQPSSGPFLAVAVSDLFGTQIEGAVLTLDLIFAILGMLTSFVLGWEMRRNSAFALAFATLTSLTPEMVTSLAWQMPTRIVFTILLPLFVWGLIRIWRHLGRREVTLLALTVFLMMSFHRLTVLVFLVATAYVLAGIVLSIHRTLRLQQSGFFLRPAFKRRAPYLALVVLGAISAATLLMTNVLEEYSVGAISSGDSREVQLLNLGVSLARSSGPLLPLSVVGVVSIAFQRNKTITEPFLLMAFLVFIPLLFLRQYTGYYTVPFTALFITIGLFAILRRFRSRRMQALAAATCIAVFLASSWAIVNYDLGITTSMSSRTYDLSLYAKERLSGTVITNEGLLGSRLHAISGMPYLPVGGATTPFQSADLLLFGFVDRNDAARTIFLVPLTQLTVDSDSPYVLPGVQAEGDWVAILKSPVSAPATQYHAYNVTYALESKEFPNEFTAYGNRYPSALYLSASNERYKVYEDSGSILFYLGG